MSRTKKSPRCASVLPETLENRALLSSVVVNTTIDGLFPPSTGIVSLRNAFATANSSTSPTTISFDPNVFATAQTIVLDGTGLALTGNQPVTVSGPPGGVTINGNGVGNSSQISVLQLTGAATSISGLAITNGTGVGIYNTTTLNLDDVSVSGNGGSPNWAGGGIYNTGSITLTNTRITNNDNELGSGGGLYNLGTAHLVDVTISGNRCGLKAVYDGGGIMNIGSLTLASAAISGNSAYNGGGIFNAATMVGSGVTISGNTAWYSGGGIFTENGPVSVENVTIVGNTASINGGGILNQNALTITNATVAGNTASSGGGLYNSNGGTITLSNTIVASDSLSGSGGVGPDACGSLNSLGYNLIGETDGSTGWNIYDLTGTTSRPLNPKLSPLGNYGGPTQTMALLPGSPALNAGWTALAVDANDNPLTTDQRGLSRVYGSSVDIGAYESQPPSLPGDVNHDGTVNLADLLNLARDFGASTPMYEGGDLNGDGTVTLSDFLELVRHFGGTSTPATPALSGTENRSVAASRRRMQ